MQFKKQTKSKGAELLKWRSVCLASVRPEFNPQYTTKDMVMHVCIFNTWNVEAEVLGVQGQSRLHSEILYFKIFPTHHTCFSIHCLPLCGHPLYEDQNFKMTSMLEIIIECQVLRNKEEALNCVQGRTWLCIQGMIEYLQCR
jgi:hypothetical protein